MYEWLLQHFFFLENLYLYSLRSGILTYGRINYLSLGNRALNILYRVVIDLRTVKYKQRGRVKLLVLITSIIQIYNEMVPVNPTALLKVKRTS